MISQKNGRTNTNCATKPNKTKKTQQFQICTAKKMGVADETVISLTKKYLIGNTFPRMSTMPHESEYNEFSNNKKRKKKVPNLLTDEKKKKAASKDFVLG